MILDDVVSSLHMEHLVESVHTCASGLLCCVLLMCCVLFLGFVPRTAVDMKSSMLQLQAESQGWSITYARQSDSSALDHWIAVLRLHDQAWLTARALHAELVTSACPWLKLARPLGRPVKSGLAVNPTNKYCVQAWNVAPSVQARSDFK